MREQELWKKVPIYFYYLSISKHILGVLLESVAQMYLTFWRNR